MSSKNKYLLKDTVVRNYFLSLLLASIFGALYEQILNLVKVYFATGDIVWSLRRGVIYGPFSPIYGVGAVLIVYF